MNDDEEKIKEREQQLKRVLKKFQVLPMEEYLKEIQKGHPLVCINKGEVGSMPGNLTGVCGLCGREIEFRPYNDIAVNKICIPCFIQQAKAAEA